MSIIKIFELWGDIELKDGGVQSKLDGIDKKARGVGDRLKGAAKTAGKWGAGIAAAAGTAAVALATKATHSAMGFEDQMTNISTLLTGDVTKSLEDMGDGIKQLARDTGTSTDILADGAYEVVSAFGEQADIMGILETANVTAVAGNATTTESVSLLSAVTKGYGDISAEATTKASDLAFQTVKLGQTSIPELSDSMGKVIPLAGSLNVKQEELFGTMATLTGVTGNTAEVSTQLRGVFSELMKPSDGLAAGLKSMGYESGEAAIESLGLQGVLDGLKDSVGGNDQALNEMFGSVQAGTAVLALTGEQSDVFTEKLGEMEDATGASADAFAKQQETVSAMMGRIKENVNVAMIELGEEFLPLLETFLEWILENMPEIQAFVSTAFDAIGTVVTIAVGLFRDHLLPVFQGIFDWASENWPAIQSIIEGVFGAIDIAWNSVLRPVFDLFLAILETLIGFIADNFPGMLSTVEGIFSGIGKAVEKVTGFFGGLIDKVKSAWEWLTTWNNTKARDKTVTTRRRTVDGSHRTGLGKVPFDGYVAELHRGEEVLTANDPRNQNNSKGLGSSTVNHTGTIRVEGVNDRGELVAVVERRIGSNVKSDNRRIPERPSLIPI